MQVEALEYEIRQLPPQDRSRIFECLIASFEEDDQIQDEWLLEAARRKAEIDSDQVSMLPGSETLALLQAKFG
jgi:hypothetical protein